MRSSTGKTSTSVSIEILKVKEPEDKTIAPRVAVERAKRSCVRFRSLCLRTAIQNPCVGICFQHPVIGGQQHRLPLLSAEEWMDKSSLIQERTRCRHTDGAPLNEDE